METLKIKHFLPTEKMYKNMCEQETTYFFRHNNTRFTVSSRLIPKRGTWINLFRAAPYVYQWSKLEEQMLPDHYKKRCYEFMTTDPQPVHWRPDPTRWRLEDKDTGKMVPVINAPIPVIYPEECNKGLWGGEGIVFGYFRRDERKRIMKLPTLPKIWKPTIKKQVLYSEILDCYMAITVTDRTMYLIDEAFGLDNYILQTHEVDLCSRLGMNLKRKMLVALAKNCNHLNDPIKREKICKRYKDFVIPEKEAEWIGLTVEEAVEKAEKEIKEANPPQPLKNSYLVSLVKQLQLDRVSKLSS